MVIDAASMILISGPSTPAGIYQGGIGYLGEGQLVPVVRFRNMHISKIDPLGCCRASCSMLTHG
jgi:hypothetical protein